MSIQNFRDYNLVLELSIPDVIPCTKRDDWFPIYNIDLPTFEVTRDVVGLFPDLTHGRDLSNGVEDGYEPKPCDYYSVSRVNKKGDYKIHCSMLVRTEQEKEIVNCLEKWWLKIYNPNFNEFKDEYKSLYVPAKIVVCSKTDDKPASKKLKCTKTFISDFHRERINADAVFFTFICENMIEEKE